MKSSARVVRHPNRSRAAAIARFAGSRAGMALHVSTTWQVGARDEAC
ncbi:MAG TPA: hypothetical protein VHB01_01340 [Nitrosospira sp.]|nr:hypothetical protein [Nitrosospira sp.]